MKERVLHICPTYFSPNSVIAGAERYSYNLAKAMSRMTTTSLVTFGPKSFIHNDDALTIRCFKRWFYVDGNKANPFSLAYLKDLLAADVIHCHQFLTVTTDLAILTGLIFRKKVFVTDLGGGTGYSLSCHLPLWKGIRSLLLISEFNRSYFRKLPVSAKVIYGGVDAARFSPGAEDKKLSRIIHVGRILSFKGIHDIVDALPENIGLDIVGQAYDEDYHRKLQERAQGKDVAFHTGLSDDQVIAMYRRSIATVLPATLDSGFTTVLESYACGTPVIASAVGSLPEIVKNDVTGFLVPPNSPDAIREKLEFLLANPDVAMEMGKRGREEVLKRYTWDAVASRCLEAYGAN